MIFADADLKLINWQNVFDVLKRRWERYHDERAISHALRWLRYRYGISTGGDIVRIVGREHIIEYVEAILDVDPALAADCVPPDMTSSHFESWLKSYDALAHDKELPWCAKHDLFDEICFY